YARRAWRATWAVSVAKERPPYTPSAKTLGRSTSRLRVRTATEGKRAQRGKASMGGRTGRSRLPTRLKLLRGETRPSRLGSADEPQPEVGRPTKPAHRGPYAAQEWDRLCELLAPLRVLTVADGPMLEATCMAYDDFRQAQDELARTGRFQQVRTKSGGSMWRK